MGFRHVLAGLAVAMLGPALAACGSSDDATERQAGAASTGGLAEQLEEPLIAEACIDAWNGPENVGNRERAARLGPDGSAVVVAAGFAREGEGEADPTGVHGCLFFVIAKSTADLASAWVVAFVEEEWHDLAAEEAPVLQPTLAGSTIGEAAVAPDGSLSAKPAGARLSKAAYLLSALRIVETYEPRASELFTMLVLDGEPWALAQAECSQRANEFHRRLETILDEIEELRPPAEIEALQAEFLATARESVDEVGAAATAAARGELACGRPMNLRIYGLPSTERAERLLDEFAERGYPLRGE